MDWEAYSVVCMLVWTVGSFICVDIIGVNEGPLHRGKVFLWFVGFLLSPILVPIIVVLFIGGIIATLAQKDEGGGDGRE